MPKANQKKTVKLIPQKEETENPPLNRIQMMQAVADEFNKGKDPVFMKKVDDFFKNPVIAVPVFFNKTEPSREELIEKTIQDVMKTYNVDRVEAERIFNKPM